MCQLLHFSLSVQKECRLVFVELLPAALSVCARLVADVLMLRQVAFVRQFRVSAAHLVPAGGSVPRELSFHHDRQLDVQLDGRGFKGTAVTVSHQVSEQRAVVRCVGRAGLVRGSGRLHDIGVAPHVVHENNVSVIQNWKLLAP